MGKNFIDGVLDDATILKAMAISLAVIIMDIHIQHEWLIHLSAWLINLTQNSQALSKYK